MPEHNEEYLGDGLYARTEGTMVILRAPRLGGEHWVGLEPEVLGNLATYLKRVDPRLLAIILRRANES